MKPSITARLEDAEARVNATKSPVRVRFGELKSLPAGYVGERHIVRGERLPDWNDGEYYQFEERPGPDPNPPPEVHSYGGAPDIEVIFVASPTEREAVC